MRYKVFLYNIYGISIKPLTKIKYYIRNNYYETIKIQLICIHKNKISFIIIMKLKIENFKEKIKDTGSYLPP